MNKLTSFAAVLAVLLVGYLVYIVATKDSWDAGVNLNSPPVGGVDTAR